MNLSNNTSHLVLPLFGLSFVHQINHFCIKQYRSLPHEMPWIEGGMVSCEIRVGVRYRLQFRNGPFLRSAMTLHT